MNGTRFAVGASIVLHFLNPDRVLAVERLKVAIVAWALFADRLPHVLADRPIATLHLVVDKILEFLGQRYVHGAHEQRLDPFGSF
jgi:hypothetical protein